MFLSTVRQMDSPDRIVREGGDRTIGVEAVSGSRCTVSRARLPKLLGISVGAMRGWAWCTIRRIDHCFRRSQLRIRAERNRTMATRDLQFGNPEGQTRLLALE